MGEYFRGKDAGHRPHVKVHKSPWLARKQIEAGAKGITCAKVSEAEVMVDGGIDDILIANEVIGADKVKRLVELSKRCKLTAIVDSLQNAREISSIATRAGTRVNLLIDVNLSSALDGILDRTGVRPGADALELAKEISKMPNLDVRGVFGYEGALRNFQGLEAKVEATKKALGALVQTSEMISASGIEAETVSCGGTLSYQTAAEFPGVTEVQAGGYLFMDLGYEKAGVDFETSLTLLTRVVSTPRPTKAIIDVGYKAVSAESGLPGVKARPDLEVISLNAEHGHLAVRDPARAPRSGERLELLPTHVDTTTCLHDFYALTRNGEVFDTVKIEARGKLQ